MTRASTADNRQLAVQLRMTLLDLARQEDERAAIEAAKQHYWEPCPASVPGHRAAATALRDRADQLLAALRPATVALAEEPA